MTLVRTKHGILFIGECQIANASELNEFKKFLVKIRMIELSEDKA